MTALTASLNRRASEWWVQRSGVRSPIGFQNCSRSRLRSRLQGRLDSKWARGRVGGLKAGIRERSAACRLRSTRKCRSAHRLSRVLLEPCGCHRCVLTHSRLRKVCNREPTWRSGCNSSDRLNGRHRYSARGRRIRLIRRDNQTRVSGLRGQSDRGCHGARRLSHDRARLSGLRRGSARERNDWRTAYQS